MKNVFLAIVILSSIIVSCTERKNRSSTADLIFQEILLANMISSTDASTKTVIGDFSLDVDDSVTILGSEVQVYLYGKDSLNGSYKVIDSNYYLKYVYRVRDNYVFKIFDNNNNFLDRGLISRREFLRMFFDDLDFQKAEFHDAYFRKRDEEYEKIQKKYSIPRKYIDSLVSVRMRSPS